MNRDQIAQSFAHLRCFPLPGTVLMPGAPLPLHVFEPRYRALVADALAGDGVLAVPQIAEGEEAQHLASPALLPYVAVGRVVLHHRLDDGRYNILVEPFARARLAEELSSDEPFRRFTAELLVDTETEAAPLRAIGRRVLGLVAPALAALGDGSERVARALRGLDPERVPMAMAPLVLREAQDRQAYIAENSTRLRAEMVEAALLALLAARQRAAAEA